MEVLVQPGKGYYGRVGQRIRALIGDHLADRHAIEKIIEWRHGIIHRAERSDDGAAKNAVVLAVKVLLHAANVMPLFSSYEEFLTYLDALAAGDAVTDAVDKSVKSIDLPDQLPYKLATYLYSRDRVVDEVDTVRRREFAVAVVLLAELRARDLSQALETLAAAALDMPVPFHDVQDLQQFLASNASLIDERRQKIKSHIDQDYFRQWYWVL
jgi:hypothetical protein